MRIPVIFPFVSLSFIFTLWSVVTASSTILQTIIPNFLTSIGGGIYMDVNVPEWFIIFVFDDSFWFIFHAETEDFCTGPSAVFTY